MELEDSSSLLKIIARQALQRNLLTNQREMPDPFDDLIAGIVWTRASSGIVRGDDISANWRDKEIMFYDAFGRRAPQTIRAAVWTNTGSIEGQDLQSLHSRAHKALHSHILKAISRTGEWREQGVHGQGQGMLSRQFTKHELCVIIDNILKEYAEASKLLALGCPSRVAFLNTERIRQMAETLGEIKTKLPSGLTAETEVVIMECPGLIPPDPESGWKRYVEARAAGTLSQDQRSRTCIYPQDPLRTLSINLALTFMLGASEATCKKNANSIAAWLLDIYNNTDIALARMRDESSKDLARSITLLSMYSLGYNITTPTDPARIEKNFLFDLVCRKSLSGSPSDLGWLAQAVNVIATWDRRNRLNEGGAHALLSHACSVFKQVFPRFGQFPQDNTYLGLSETEASISAHFFSKLSRVHGAGILGDLWLHAALDEKAPLAKKFAAAFPKVLTDHPDILDRFLLGMRHPRPSIDEEVGTGQPTVAELEGQAQWRKRLDDLGKKPPSR